MNRIIDCPMCDGKAELNFELKIRKFRKEEFKLYEAFYKCNTCNEDFTNTEIDEFNVSQVYNQYREKHSISSPEQLTNLKNKYGLNSTSFSKLLGFGVNQFASYENGEIPNDSNATLLNLCRRPKEVLTILEGKKELFTLNKYDNVKQKLLQLIEAEKKEKVDFFKTFFNENEQPNQFNGYSIPSFEKFANMVIYFINIAPFKTRLNKLLFYSDFGYYKYFGKSISGMEYAAIPMGPVPELYEMKFGLLANNNFISTELENINDKEADKFVTQKEFNKKLFNENELKLMQQIINHFRYKKTDEIILISHKEKAWLKNKEGNNLISYLDYAPQLIEI